MIKFHPKIKFKLHMQRSGIKIDIIANILFIKIK